MIQTKDLLQEMIQKTTELIGQNPEKAALIIEKWIDEEKKIPSTPSSQTPQDYQSGRGMVKVDD